LLQEHYWHCDRSSTNFAALF